MVRTSELYITSLVIFRALFPGRSGWGALAADDTFARSDLPRSISPAAVAWYLGNLRQVARRDGGLSLLFPGCRAPAAPFLLFRLKREGFSNCVAVADVDGLRLYADR